jgi:DNA-directed RNA polymerase II subunit RPB2
MTGEQIESEIYMGPTYYTRLKHMTQDKINYRSRGPRAALTRQTNHGRSKDGGLRIGDMERDSILSHGMSAFMYDSMMNRGDYYKMAICNQSGTIAIYNRSTQNFYSPLIDGPLQFDQVDKETFVPNLITKYGKDFSIVEIPYCLKLLMHELTTMNVQMRLITADTIDSLTTAGKRSLGNFQKWTQKEMPEEPLEKAKIEKLLNQSISEEEYQAMVDPKAAEPENELEEYVPKPNNDPPMVLQPLAEETDSDEEPDQKSYMPPMAQPTIVKKIEPILPSRMESSNQAQDSPPEVAQEPSQESDMSEVAPEPKKDVKKISFAK